MCRTVNIISGLRFVVLYRDSVVCHDIVVVSWFFVKCASQVLHDLECNG